MSKESVVAESVVLPCPDENCPYTYAATVSIRLRLLEGRLVTSSRMNSDAVRAFTDHIRSHDPLHYLEVDNDE